jgi:hypothetical protein
MSESTTAGLHLFVRAEVANHVKVPMPTILKKWHSLTRTERSKWNTRSVSPSLSPLSDNERVTMYEYK